MNGMRKKKFVNILADYFKGFEYKVDVRIEPLKDNEYVCGHCGEINEKGWSDEEALAEAAEIFGKPVSEWTDIPVVICDDCFQKMHPLKPENVQKLLNARAKN